MTTRLIWVPARADELFLLSAKLRLVWVTSGREGTLTRMGHAAELPSSLSVPEALADYEAGPGAGRAGAARRWELWDRGRMAASG